jgi:hypothetical protein
MKKFDNRKIGLTTGELAVLTKLSTPQKIQGFVNAIPQNFEPDGDSCMSVREVLRTNRAHCMEGAILAALALWIQGERPLIVDLSANDEDDDHIITLFQEDGYWGAISKGNHAYVRYRDPVYRTLRELVMSYFHEYYNTAGKKTLRTYSRPLDLSKYKPEQWISGKDAWKVAEDICEIRHFNFLTKKQEKILRPVDEIQMRITKHRVHEEK